jgi:exopolysaccharide biosynthesis polyprenyl glycosylphosphotransferase
MLRLFLAGADIVLALIVVAGATNIRFGQALSWPTEGSTSLPDPHMAATVFVAMWVAVLWAQGLYRGKARWTRRGELTAVLRATLIQLVLTLSLLYVFKYPDVSRLLLIVIFPSLALAALGIRMAVRQFLILLRDHGRNVRYMLVVGANPRANAFADLVECHPELGLVVVGHLKADPSDGGVILSRPLLGMIEDIEQILHTQIVDEVAICLPLSMEDMIEEMVSICQEEGKVIRMPVAPFGRNFSTSRIETVDGVGVFSLAKGPDKTVDLLLKRLLDIVGSAILLVVLSPFMAGIALAIKLDSKGPIFFRQERVGLHGRPIGLVKFRSMCKGAEKQLSELMADNEINGHAFKLSDDPRTTRIGRILRRTSLDELPQLWNVLRGQMSLVGPRPPLPTEVANYDVWHRRRLSMKPGITGLWQVGARRSQEFDHWVQQDLTYIDSWSLWLDLKIIARTVPAVLTGTGR